MHNKFTTLSGGFKVSVLCVCVYVLVGVKNQRECGEDVRKEKLKSVRGVCQRQ